jgi:hypothetical protein
MLSRWRQRVDRIARIRFSDADTADERIYKEPVNLSALLIGVLSCLWVYRAQSPSVLGALALWSHSSVSHRPPNETRGLAA